MTTIKATDPKARCECGQLRVNTPSGCVCPAGHGKLLPARIVKSGKPPKWPKERIAATPTAWERLTFNGIRLFSIDGCVGIWEKLMCETFREGEDVPDNHLHARDVGDSGYPKLFKRRRDYEELLRKLLEEA